MRLRHRDSAQVIDCSHYLTSDGLFLKSTWDKRAPRGPRGASAFVFHEALSLQKEPRGAGVQQHLSADELAPLNNSSLGTT